MHIRAWFITTYSIRCTYMCNIVHMYQESWAHGRPTMLSNLRMDLRFESLLGVWRCFYDPQKTFWCFQISQRGNMQHPPTPGWVLTCWKFFFCFNSFHRILALLQYILQHRKIMSRCLDPDGVPNQQAFVSVRQRRDTVKIVVKAAVC